MNRLIALLAVVLCCCKFALSSTKRKEPIQDADGPIVPWLQPPGWDSEYVGMENDLPALLKNRALENWVSLFCFSLPEKSSNQEEEASLMRLTLNALYSYRVFGQSNSDIVAALSPRALAECKRFRLPCYNATKYTSGHSYKSIGWAKVQLSRDILKAGYNLHLSDLDVSYVKPLSPAITQIFSQTNDAADGSMMEETWVHQDNPNDTATRRTIYLGNLGVVFLKANPRTIGFLEALLKWASDQNQDQYMVTIIAYQAWAPCADEASCLSIRSRNMAAITLHPSQFAGSNCVPEPRYSLCSWRRLYVHAICRATSRDKEGFLRHVKAMFIPAEPVDAAGNSAALGRQDNAAIAASGLPCPVGQQRAWREPSRPPHDGEHSSGGDGRARARALRLRGRK